MDINKAIALAKTIMGNHSELKNWKVTSNNRKRAFGICSYGKSQIELSSVLVPIMTDKAILDTIIHEIAHALTRGHNHDNVWKRKCIELGGDGKRCGGTEKYKDEEAGKVLMEKLEKYTLTCPVCNAKTSMSRLPKRSYSCINHGSRYYNPEYKLIISQNF